MPKGIFERHLASEETKKKMSLARMGYVFSAESRKKISESRKRRKQELGYLNSPETRAKISSSLKGQHSSPSTEFKKGIVPWNTGTSTPEKKKRSRTSAILRHKYGIDLDAYEEMLKKQKGVCLICGKSETKKTRYGGISTLHIDHDHTNGRIRGLLCHKCNCAIGMFCEDTQILEKAIKYLSQ
jgi:hypothetical protein